MDNRTANVILVSLASLVSLVCASFIIHSFVQESSTRTAQQTHTNTSSSSSSRKVVKVLDSFQCWDEQDSEYRNCQRDHITRPELYYMDSAGQLTLKSQWEAARLRCLLGQLWEHPGKLDEEIESGKNVIFALGNYSSETLISAGHESSPLVDVRVRCNGKKFVIE